VKYLPFWGHHPRSDGSVGAGCLSQWWPAEFTVDGQVFPTAEHYMMWRKAMLFDDGAIAAEVLEAGSPGAAKAWGRPARRRDRRPSPTGRDSRHRRGPGL
jgi:ribA/ribD-fused uncharacterized protein